MNRQLQTIETHYFQINHRTFSVNLAKLTHFENYTNLSSKITNLKQNCVGHGDPLFNNVNRTGNNQDGDIDGGIITLPRKLYHKRELARVLFCDSIHSDNEKGSKTTDDDLTSERFRQGHFCDIDCRRSVKYGIKYCKVHEKEPTQNKPKRTRKNTFSSSEEENDSSFSNNDLKKIFNKRAKIKLKPENHKQWANI